MQTFLETIATEAFKILTNKMFMAVLSGVMVLFYWVKSMLYLHEFPNDPYILSQDPQLHTKNSAYVHLQHFFASKSSGVTLFWGLQGIQKAFLTKHTSKEYEGEVSVDYVNCNRISGSKLKTMVYNKLGISENSPHLKLRITLKPRRFLTIVLDNFDKILENNIGEATSFVQELAEESLGNKFNVLILLNKAKNAHDLLQQNIQQLRLLGSKKCGRWTTSDVKNLNIDKKYLDMVDTCETLTPVINAKNIKLRFLVATEKNDWMKGEEMLDVYWDDQNA